MVFKKRVLGGALCRGFCDAKWAAQEEYESETLRETPGFVTVRRCLPSNRSGPDISGEKKISFSTKEPSQHVLPHLGLPSVSPRLIMLKLLMN